jgi:hypothetical protein
VPPYSLAPRSNLIDLSGVSDRLKKLQRQRALAAEQLAWLDREIAREAGTASVASPSPTPSATTITPVAPPTPASADAKTAAAARAEAEAEAMMAEYRRDAESVQSSVKKGCFLYFFGAFALLALGLTAFYFLHPGR